MPKHVINIGVCYSIDKEWIALCDNYEAETDHLNCFYLRILSPGWKFDYNAPAPTGPGYPALVSPKHAAGYSSVHGPSGGVWVDDPSSAFEVKIRGKDSITLTHGAGHGIDRHQYAICLIDGSTPPNRCILDPYMKDKPGG